ncbi:hypothetical protein L226DRAFT_567831 [Lentinus tigrinus ALCF2SS1-7]|uniref:uncharacterized protein n=1 Tax=Lentinus tigrinus ALCF2SS1-7 TaxID=1328758 RepID=UPI00116632E6|nr:hypothetical protein L226DRAFT_567831 [Lentinus tigrinus ALCF2SS1-7]
MSCSELSPPTDTPAAPPESLVPLDTQPSAHESPDGVEIASPSAALVAQPEPLMSPVPDNNNIATLTLVPVANSSISVSPPPSVLRKRLMAQPKVINTKNTKTHLLGSHCHQQDSIKMNIPNKEQSVAVATFWKPFGQDPLPPEELEAAQTVAGQPLQFSLGEYPVPSDAGQLLQFNFAQDPISSRESETAQAAAEQLSSFNFGGDTMLVDDTSLDDPYYMFAPIASTGAHPIALLPDHPPPSSPIRAPVNPAKTTEYPVPSHLQASKRPKQICSSVPAQY